MKAVYVSYEEALRALRDGAEHIFVSKTSKYKQNQQSFNKFVDELAQNKTCTVLDMKLNCIGPEGAVSLGRALERNTILRKLDLSLNYIGDIGAIAIAKALECNTALVELDLSCDPYGYGLGPMIDNAGAVAIAKALKTNTTLEVLFLDWNDIGTEGCEAIREALEYNHTLTILRLGDFKIAEEVEGALYEKHQRRLLDVLNSDTKAPLNRSRVMFVGQGRAGKSATVRSLSLEGFVSEWNSTAGVDIKELRTSENKYWEEPWCYRDFTTQFAARLVFTPNGVTRKSQLPSSQNNNHQVSAAETVRVDYQTVPSKNSFGVLKGPDIMRESSNFFDAKRSIDSLTLSLWDFGGQEVFYSMHHLFLTKSGVYVVVFDMRELSEPSTRTEAKTYLLFWLRSIKLHAPNVSVLLVGTFLADIIEEKYNLQDIDKILRELTKLSFAKIVIPANFEHEDLIFFPIDNKEKMGIASLCDAIEQCARVDNSTSREVSVRWMTFLDSILGQKENQKAYLTFSDEVKSLGTNLGIPSISEQEEALTLFHERGFLIHMTSTEILKNIVVLDPQWLIGALSKVICDGSIHINIDQFKEVGLEDDARVTYEKGLASRDFLDFVWKNDQVEFFIDLMKRTMLLSEWDRESYLIPSLLRDTYVIPETNIVGLRCVFDFSASFLPNGVFQRLVCLCVELSSRNFGNTHSKLYENFAAIVLQQGMVRLLETKETQTVTLYVEDDSAAGNLLTIIQSMLQKVNSDVMGAGLTWETYVENSNTNELIRLSEAQPRKLSPWFNSDGLLGTKKKEISSQSVDLDTFLGSL